MVDQAEELYKMPPRTGMSEYVVKCNLCGADNTKLLFIEKGFNTLKCQKCGLIYLNPRPSEQEVRKIYSKDFFTGQSSCGIQGTGGYLATRELIIKSANETLKTIEKYREKGRILDVGCATGFFLQTARIWGWETYGVEISKYASQYARQKLDLNVFAGKLTQARYESDYFDVITMFDVLSHLEDPLGNFCEMNRILKREGMIILRVGNKGWLYARLSWGYWGAPEHLYHFTKGTLKKMLEKAGFRIVRRIGVNSGIIPMKSLQKIGIAVGSRTKELVNTYLNLPKRIIGFLVRTLNVTGEMLVIAIKAD